MGQKVLEFGRRPFSSRVVLFMPTVEPVLRGLKPLPPRYDRSNARLLPFRVARRFREFVNPGKQRIHEFRDSLVPFSLFRQI